MTHVYVFVDPITDEPVYVGCTAEPKEREQSHRLCLRRGACKNKRLQSFYDQRIKDGIKLVFKIIAQSNRKQEGFAIELAIQKVLNLKNHRQ